jgi:hypothetical protein
MITWADQGKKAFATAAKGGDDPDTIEAYSVALDILRDVSDWKELDNHEKAVANRMLNSFMGGGIIESELISVFDYVNKSAEHKFSNTTEKDRQDTREPDDDDEVEDAVDNKGTETETNSKGFSDAWNDFFKENKNKTFAQLNKTELQNLFNELNTDGNDTIDADALKEKLKENDTYKGYFEKQKLSEIADVDTTDGINYTEFSRIQNVLKGNPSTDTKGGNQDDAVPKVNYTNGVRTFEEMQQKLNDKKLDTNDDDGIIQVDNIEHLIDVFADDVRYKAMPTIRTDEVDYKITELHKDGFTKDEYKELSKFVDNIIEERGLSDKVDALQEKYAEDDA